MVFQYDNAPRATEVERKLKELKDHSITSYNDIVNNATLPEKKERLPLNLKPNHIFLNAYNERKVKEEAEAKKEAFLDSLDEQGYKLEKIYKNEHFQKIHDPLNLYSSKQNYDDLAWKVFNDVPSDEAYLKTLYYPELRSEDYSALIRKFSDCHGSNGYKLKFSLFGGVFGLVGGFALSTKFNFRYRTAIISSLALSYLSYRTLNCFFLSLAKKKLNNFAITEIAPKYSSELKFTSVTHGQVN